MPEPSESDRRKSPSRASFPADWLALLAQMDPWPTDESDLARLVVLKRHHGQFDSLAPLRPEARGLGFEIYPLARGGGRVGAAVALSSSCRRTR